MTRVFLYGCALILAVGLYKAGRHPPDAFQQGPRLPALPYERRDPPTERVKPTAVESSNRFI